MLDMKINRPLLGSKNSHFQNEARCTTFLVKMSFICMRMKNDFHIKGWAPTLILKLKPGGTRKWPIDNLKWEAMCLGLKIMAGQRTMSTLNGILAGQKLHLPVLYTLIVE